MTGWQEEARGHNFWYSLL